MQDGLLVLADIAGYTTFVTQTEIDHSWEILHELLEVMVPSAEGRARLLSRPVDPDIRVHLLRDMVDQRQRRRFERLYSAKIQQRRRLHEGNIVVHGSARLVQTLLEHDRAGWR